MVTGARGFPRFLPTLTEVILAPVAPPEPPEDLVALAAARREAFAAQLRSRLGEAMDRRLPDVVAAAMLEQIDFIAERLRQEMEEMVRQSLEAISDRLRVELSLLVRDAVDNVLTDDPSEPAVPATQ